MRAKIFIEYFGQKKKVEIVLGVGNLRLSPKSRDIFVNKAVFAETNSILKDIMKLENDVNFRAELFSPQLQQISKTPAQLDIESISQAIALTMLNYILKQYNKTTITTNRPIDIKEAADLLQKFKKKYEKLWQRFYHEQTRNIPSKKKSPLQKFIGLIKQKNYKDAREIKIEKNKLSKNEKIQYCIYDFELMCYLNPKEKESHLEEFNLLIKKFDFDTSVVIKLWFIFIKYLEDIRENKLVDSYLKSLPKMLNIANLDEEDRAYYYFLEGRSLYRKGEFIKANNVLYNSFKMFSSLGDKKNIARVLNTAVNTYADNGYFKYARFLAERALELRKEIGSNELGDTYGVLANCYFKQRNYKKSYDYYKKSLAQLEKSKNDLSRTYNYLAKSALFSKKMKEAEAYIKKSEKSSHKQTVKHLGFLKLIKLLLYYKKEKTSQVEKIFKDFIDPGNIDKFDPFCLGWAYYIYSQIAISKQDIKLAISYADDSIHFFLGEKYYLEAAYVWANISLYQSNKNILPHETEFLQLYDRFVKAILDKNNFAFCQYLHEEKIKDNTILVEFDHLIKQMAQSQDKKEKAKSLKQLNKLMNLY